MKTHTTPIGGGAPTLREVLKWLGELEDISLEHGHRNLDNDLEYIAACQTYLRRLR
jgi:hypothetical protein